MRQPAKPVSTISKLLAALCTALFSAAALAIQPFVIRDIRVEGVQRTAEMLGEAWQTIWPCFSTVPARLMGLDIALAPGQPASFCLVETDAANQPKCIRVYLNGAEAGRSN